jgi:hypothetical protein
VAPFDELANPRTLIALAVEAEEHGWDGFFLWDPSSTGRLSALSPTHGSLSAQSPPTLNGCGLARSSRPYLVAACTSSPARRSRSII